MCAIKLILADHEKLKKLLKQVEQTSERAVQKRKELFAIIKHEATVHEKMEELTMYKLLKEFEENRPNVFEYHEEVVLSRTHEPAIIAFESEYRRMDR